MSKLFNKTLLQENKKIYFILFVICFLVLIFLYFISQIIFAFIEIDKEKVDSETSAYVQLLEASVNFDVNALQAIRGEGSIERFSKECNLDEYRGSSVPGCPILIPDNDQFGDRQNPFDVNN